MQQQQEKDHGLFEIRKSSRQGYKALLPGTQADWAVGTRAVQETQRRVCLDARLKTRDMFKRHFESTEVHPLKRSRPTL
jgi:hypothetical protein